MKKKLMAALFFVLGTILFAQAATDTGFSETELTLKTPAGDIFGTLTIPDNAKSSPVVLIIAGSGPTDRNGNSPLGVRTDTYKKIAEGLAGNGVSSLRFDKRGIAASRAAMASEADLRFETYINDVKGWISMLNSDKRFSKVIVLGHSEGSLIGMVAAGQTQVGGFISVSGVGKTVDQTLREQLKPKLPESMFDEASKALDSLKMGMTVQKVNPALISLFRPSVQPYMISWIKYNPTEEIKKLKAPVMIIQGTTDIQVTVEDAKLLAAAKPDARLKVFDGMNHVLKESEIDMQKNMATYANPELPLKAGFMDSIVNFIMAGK